MLVPVVMCFILLYRNAEGSQSSGKIPRLPGFLVAFVVIVIINSLGAIPATVADGMTDLSRWCLVTAIAGLGIKTSFQKLAVVGWKPVILMVSETLFLLGLVLSFIMFGLVSL